MILNNALVTWNELNTMGLTLVGGSAPTGNKIVTKGDINTYYYTSTTSVPYINYTNNRCPRYQDIVSAGVPATIQSYGYTDTFAGECFCCPGQYETQRDYTVVFNTAATSNGYLAIVYDDASGGNYNFYIGDTVVGWFSNCGCINPCLTITSVTVIPT